MGWQDAPLAESARPKWQDAPEVGAAAQPKYMSAPEVNTPGKAPNSPQEASKYQTDTKAFTDQSGTSYDPLGRSVPQMRQGSAADIQVAPLGERLQPEFQGPPTRSTNFMGGGKGLGQAFLEQPLFQKPLELYQKYAVDPIKHAIFGEDIPPGIDATKAEQSAYALKQVGKQLVSDPLVYGLGLRGLGRSVTKRLDPQPGVPLEAPVVHVDAPSTQGQAMAPMTPIQDLAQQHQAETLTSAPSTTAAAPGEATLFPSRRLHGNDPLQGKEGPPTPLFQAGIDKIRARESRRSQEGTIPSPLVLPKIPAVTPSLDSLLHQPAQMGLRGEQTLVTSLPSLTQKSLPMSRFLKQTYDVLAQMGPYTREIGDILQHTFDYSEAGTKQNFLDYLGLVRSIYGQRRLRTKLALGAAGELKSFLNASIRDFGLTENEVKALVELHEVGSKLAPSPSGKLDLGQLERLVSPHAWKTLRGELSDPRLHHLWNDGWKIATGRASSDPFIQSMARIHDPITGKSTPVGQASSFWPHQPIKDRTKQFLNEASLKRIYNNKGYSDTMPYDVFKKNMKAWMDSSDPAVKYRRYHGVENMRHIDMLEDAKSHNRTVYDSLKFYGYETDPLRMQLHHNLYTLKRAKFLEYKDRLDALMEQIHTDYGGPNKSYVSKEADWINKAIERSQGISAREDQISAANWAWGITQSIMYPAFLKASWLQNFALQPNFVWQITGLRPIAQAHWRLFAKQLGLNPKEVLDSAERSAANFPSFIAKYHHPNGFVEQYAKTANTMNFFAPSDWWTRNWSSAVFVPHAENLIRKWYQDPSNPKWQRALQEGNLNPKELLQKMSASDRSTWDASGMPPIPQEAILRYAQVQTNRAMGRTGVRSLPLVMSGDSQVMKVFMMLHRQVASNEGVFIRNIMNAPTAGVGLNRALRAVFGAEVTGTVYQGLVNWIADNNFFDVNEPLVKSFGGHKEAAFAAKALLMGMGTFTAGIILSGLNAHAGNYGGASYGVVNPAAAAFIDELYQKVSQGRFGDVAWRMNPSQAIDIYQKRQTKKAKALKHAPMPGQGLNTGIGLSQ